jgi:hypothetical protein
MQHPYSGLKSKQSRDKQGLGFMILDLILLCIFFYFNSMALVHERTIPTLRPPLINEVTANFLLIEGCCVVSAAVPLRP